MHCQHLTRDVLLSKRCIVKTTKNKPKPRDVLLKLLKIRDVFLKKMYCYKKRCIVTSKKKKKKRCIVTRDVLFLKKDMLKKM